VSPFSLARLDEACFGGPQTLKGEWNKDGEVVTYTVIMTISYLIFIFAFWCIICCIIIIDGLVFIFAW
jgi:hypothetical protein